MFKKITLAVMISALAALSLASIAGASVGDSFDITGVDTDRPEMGEAAGYVNFTIANGDPNEEGRTGQIKVQLLGLSASNDPDEPGNDGGYTDFTIANGDPNEEGRTGQIKVQPSPVDYYDDGTTTGSGETTLPNIGASDPAEQ